MEEISTLEGAWKKAFGGYSKGYYQALKAEVVRWTASYEIGVFSERRKPWTSPAPRWYTTGCISSEPECDVTQEGVVFKDAARGSACSPPRGFNPWQNLAKRAINENSCGHDDPAAPRFFRMTQQVVVRTR